MRLIAMNARRYSATGDLAGEGGHVGVVILAMFSWNNQVDADADMAESFNGKIARTQVQ